MISREIKNQCCLTFHSNFSPRKHRRRKNGGNYNKFKPKNCKRYPYLSAAPYIFCLILKVHALKEKRNSERRYGASLLKIQLNFHCLFVELSAENQKVFCKGRNAFIEVPRCSSAQRPLMKACSSMLSSPYLHGMLHFLTHSEILRHYNKAQWLLFCQQGK